MAPVSTVKAVRSTPAAFKPMRMLRPIKKAFANLARPMRVEGARLLSFFRRRSIQRLIQAATSTNSVSVNSSFNTDQTVTRLLPAAMPMLSSPAMIGSSQPRYSAAITSQMNRVSRLSRCCSQDLIAETGREQQHADAHDDIGADQAHRGVEHRHVEVRRHENSARQEHQAHRHQHRRDHDHAVRGEMVARKRRRHLDCEAMVAVAQRGADEPARFPRDTRRSPRSPPSTLRVNKISKKASMCSQYSIMR